MRHFTIFALILFFFTLLFASTMMTVDSRVAAFGSTPSTTPVPYLQLPDWVSDPAVNVFIATTSTDVEVSDYEVTLVNVDSGERFSFDWPYVDEADWYQVQGRLFLRLWRYHSSGADNSEGFVEYVDIETGQLTRYALDDPARPDRQNTTPDPTAINANGIRYQITDGTTVSMLTDTDEISLENPVADRNFTYIHAAWHGDYLHVRYWDYIDLYYIEGEDVIYDSDGDIIMIFEAATSPIWAYDDAPLVLYRTDDDQFCRLDIDVLEPDCDLFADWQLQNERHVLSVAWSHDNNEILFFYRVGESETGGLCRYTIDTRATDCIWERTIEYSPFSAYTSAWLDETTLIFTYWNVPEESFDTRSPRDTGMCLLNLDTNDVQCPTDDLFPSETYYRFNVISPSRDKIAIAYTAQYYDAQDGLCIYDRTIMQSTCPVTAEDLDGWYIEVVGWSRDGRHLVVMYSPYGPLSDDKSFSRFGFVDVAANTYRDEGYAYLEYGLLSAWRP